MWTPKGRRHVIRTVKYAPKVHAWGCFSFNGFGRLYIFQDNLNADLLVTIYEEALLPSAQEIEKMILFFYSDQSKTEILRRKKKKRKW